MDSVFMFNYITGLVEEWGSHSEHHPHDVGNDKEEGTSV